MPKDIPDSETLSSFTTDPIPILEKLRRSGEPMLLTIESGDGVIVQDAGAYQRFLETVARLETLAAVREGLKDVEAGRVRPMREALEALARKHDLPSRW